MALVRGRNVNQALAAAAYSIVARYGRRMGNEAIQELQDAIIQGAEQGGQAFQRYLSQWVHHAGNELGREAVDIANQVAAATRSAMQQGGRLWNALQESTTEVALDTNGELTSQIPRNNNDQLSQRDPTTLDEIMPDASQANNGANAEITLARAGATAASGPGGSNPVSKETPISNYPTLTYGLQETR